MEASETLKSVGAKSCILFLVESSSSSRKYLNQSQL